MSGERIQTYTRSKIEKTENFASNLIELVHKSASFTAFFHDNNCFLNVKPLDNHYLSQIFGLE